MRALIQKVSRASVTVENQITGHIGKGFLVLLGIENEDNRQDAEWLSSKIVGMRIFEDGEGKMNLSLKQVEGQILLISQFTLHASTKKGNRPSFIKAARPDKAIPLYEDMKHMLEDKLGKKTETGDFGAFMQVELVNEGPVTIWIDSKNRE